jgi:hypothetical protein
LAVPAEIAVTTPDVLTVATPVAELLQVPPDTALARVIVLPMQSVVGVEGVIAGGAAFTVKVAVTLQVPIAYVIIDVPANTPVATPVVEPIVAFAVLPLVHEPPATVFDNVTVPPSQTVGDAGVIAAGDVFTVTVFIAKHPVAIT